MSIESFTGRPLADKSSLSHTTTTEVVDRPSQALVESDCRLPAEQVPGLIDARTPLHRVIYRQRGELDAAAVADKVYDLVGELQHGELVRVAEVDGPRNLA